MTEENVGWNPQAQDDAVFPIVFIACKVCQKRIAVIHLRGEFAKVA
jgi:hypothetical protein